MLLARLFSEAAFAVVGVQEARGQDRELQVGSYMVVSSPAAPTGQYGCQLWVDMEAAISPADPDLRFHPAHCASVVSEPRLLIAN